MVRGPLRKEPNGSPPLLLLLLAATIPLAITGAIAYEWIEENTRTPMFVAFGFITTGALLIVSGWYESRFAAKESIGWKQAIGASIGQALAVLPGFSRSGLTIASGRLMGATATKATEFAFLLAIPALSGALFLTLQSGTTQLMTIGWIPLLVGFTSSAFSSLIVIQTFLATVRRYGIWMWSAYLFIAAALIIADEMLPLVQAIPEFGESLELRVVVGALFLALLLEAAPFTSLFVPGFASMVAIGILYRNDPWNLMACIPIGAVALIIGNLLGYIPARQAHVHVRWKEKADQRLMKAQKFFHKWGYPAVFFGGWYGPTRSMMSIAAGLGNMRPIPFVLTVAASSIVWVSAVLWISATVARSF